MEQLTRADRLKEAARELWGDTWTLRTLEFADGSTDHVVYRSRGLVEGSDGKLLERDRLVLDDTDEIVHTRERVEKETRRNSELISRDVDA